MRDPELLADYIEEKQINRCFISPKMLKVFRVKGNSLKVVSTGSERVFDTYSRDYKIQVAYGQTESAGAVMMFEIDKKYDNTPIGKPIGNVKVYILDENNIETIQEIINNVKSGQRFEGNQYTNGRT